MKLLSGIRIQNNSKFDGGKIISTDISQLKEIDITSDELLEGGKSEEKMLILFILLIRN